MLSIIENQVLYNIDNHECNYKSFSEFHFVIMYQ